MERTPTEGADRFVEFNLQNAQLQRVHRPYNQNYNYEPRVGFAWDAYGDGKTIVRSAYAIMADQPTANAVTGLAGNSSVCDGGFVYVDADAAAGRDDLQPGFGEPRLRWRISGLIFRMRIRKPITSTCSRRWRRALC